MRNLTFAIFLCYLAAVTAAISAPVRTDKITAPVPILSSMAWLADPDSKYTMANIDSQGVQGRFRHLQGGFPITSTGAGWLRLELEKTPPSVGTLPRSSTNQLTLHVNTLPPGSTTIFYQNNNAPVTTPGYWYSTKMRAYETFVLPEPPLNGTIIYLHFEETPDLWFNPSLSRGVDSGSYFFPPTLLLPGIFLVLASVCLLRSLRDRAMWPFWASLIFAAVFIQLAYPLPTAQQQLNFSAIPALLAPGLCLLVFPHLGRLMLQPRAYSIVQDSLLKTSSILGVIISIIPLIPGYMWLTRLFLLWPLLLALLLPFCFSALTHKRPGALPFTGACLMGFAGALLTLCSIAYPDLHYMAAYGSMWGLAVGGAGLIFARVPQEEVQTASTPENLALLDQHPPFYEPEEERIPPHISLENAKREEDEHVSNLMVSHAFATDHSEPEPPATSPLAASNERQAEAPIPPEGSAAEEAPRSPVHVEKEVYKESSFIGTVPLPKDPEGTMPKGPAKENVGAQHGPASTLAQPVQKAPEFAVSPPAPSYPPITNPRVSESTSAKGIAGTVSKGTSPLVTEQKSKVPPLSHGKEVLPTKQPQPEKLPQQNIAAPIASPAQGKGMPGPQTKPGLPTLQDLPAILKATKGATAQEHDSAPALAGLSRDHPGSQTSVAPNPTLSPPLSAPENAEKKIRIISLADDNFMDFSDMQRGYGTKSLGAPGKAQIFSLHRLLKEVSASIESVAQKKGILFSWFIAPSLPATLEGDATNLRHVLSLLLQNALQATQKGTVQLFVRPTSGGGPSDMGNLQFSISDTGAAQRSDLGFSHAWEFAERTGGNFSIEYSATGGTLVMFSSCFMVPSEEVARLSLTIPPAKPAESTTLVTAEVLPPQPAREPTPRNNEQGTPSPLQPLVPGPDLIHTVPVSAKPEAPLEAIPTAPPLQVHGNRAQKLHPRPQAKEVAKPLLDDGISPAIPRIIIAGMTTSNKRLLSHYMSDIGHLFVEAHDILEAVELCRQMQPVLVMYDADSPEDAIFTSMSAIATEQKRQGATTPLAQLVFVGHEAQGKRMLDHGATHIMVKPFSPENLTSLVKTAVPQFRDRQENNIAGPSAPSAHHPVPESVTSAVAPAQPGVSLSAELKTLPPEPKAPERAPAPAAQKNVPVSAVNPDTALAHSLPSGTEASTVIHKPQVAPLTGNSPILQSVTAVHGAVTAQGLSNRTISSQHPNPPVPPAQIPTQQNASQQGVPQATAAKNELQATVQKHSPASSSAGPQPHRAAAGTRAPQIQIQPVLKFPAGTPGVSSPAPVQPPTAQAAPAAEAVSAAPSSTTTIYGEKKQPSITNTPSTQSTTEANASSTPSTQSTTEANASSMPSTDTLSATSAPETPSPVKAPAVSFQRTQGVKQKKVPAVPEVTPEQARPVTGPTLAMGEGPPQVSPGTFYPLPDFPDESIDAIMLPLIPGFLHTLDGSLAAAVKGRDEHQTLFVQDAVALLATKAEIFNLEKLSKIARCVERAAAADDFEAVDVLLDDLITVAKRYGNSLKTFYNNYLNQHR